MMQTAPAVGEATFQTFDAIVYAIIYLGGALWLLAGTDPRLAVPLIPSGSGSASGWSPGRFPGSARASKAFSDARSAITGRIVDSYTNITSVKLFAHTRSEEAHAGEGDRACPSDLHGPDADHHADGSGPDGDQWPADRRG